MTKSNIKSIAQARAAFAWEKAQQNNTKEYGTLVNKVPAIIKTNGLLNTLAFLYSKKTSGKHGVVLDNITDWLTKGEYKLIENSTINSADKMISYLLSKNDSDARFLIQCTSEVLALFNWLRRFATKE